MINDRQTLDGNIVLSWSSHLEPVPTDPQSIIKLIDKIRLGYYPVEDSAIEPLNLLVHRSVSIMLAKPDLALPILQLLAVLSFFISQPRDRKEGILIYDYLSLLLYRFIGIADFPEDVIFASLHQRDIDLLKKFPQNSCRAQALLDELAFAYLRWPQQAQFRFYERHKDIIYYYSDSDEVLYDWKLGNEKFPKEQDLNATFDPLDNESKVSYISINSIKGGVGKSTISLLLAYYLAEQLDKKVFLIDCDASGSSMRHFFGLKRNSRDTFKLFEKCKAGNPLSDGEVKILIDGCELKVTPNLHVFLLPSSHIKRHRLSVLMSVEETFKKVFDYLERLEPNQIILDCSPGLFHFNESLTKVLTRKKSVLLLLSSSDESDLRLNLYNLHWDLLRLFPNKYMVWLINKSHRKDLIDPFAWFAENSSDITLRYIEERPDDGRYFYNRLRLLSVPFFLDLAIMMGARDGKPFNYRCLFDELISSDIYDILSQSVFKSIVSFDSNGGK